jgi:hypothetical protein
MVTIACMGNVKHWVYFARADNGLVKIGTSAALRKRLTSIRAQAPGAVFLGIVPGDRVREAKLHAKFAHLRRHGEWFAPGDDLMSFIQRHAQREIPADPETIMAIRITKEMADALDSEAMRLCEQYGLECTRSHLARKLIVEGIKSRVG